MWVKYIQFGKKTIQDHNNVKVVTLLEVGVFFLRVCRKLIDKKFIVTSIRQSKHYQVLFDNICDVI